MSPIIYLLLLVIAAPFIWYFANRDVDKSNFKASVETEANNILFYTRRITDYLCLLDDNHFSYFDYEPTFYEVLFFLYALESVKIINNNKDNNFLNLIEKNVLSKLENESLIKYAQKKNIILEVYSQRKLFYMPLIHEYNYKLNTDFFLKVFDYQADKLSNNYKTKTDAKDKMKLILEETLPTFSKFYTDYI